MENELAYNGFFKVAIVNTIFGSREVIRATNSVGVFFYYPLMNEVLLIKEPRASMITEDNPNGITTQTVAGRFDVDLSLKDLMIKEAEEEAGIIISADDIVMLNGGQPMSVSAGMTNELCYLGVVELQPEMVCNDQKFFGREDEGEQIERVWMKIDEFIQQPTSCLRVFAFQQWLITNLGRQKERSK